MEDSRCWFPLEVLRTAAAAGAEVLGISVPTADRWWNFSRAWLFEEIEREQKS